MSDIELTNITIASGRYEDVTKRAISHLYYPIEIR